MEEFRKRFRFIGYGEAGEKTSFTGQDGQINRFLPVYVLGKTFNFRVETDEDYAALPPAGTMLYLQGLLKRRKSSVEGMSGVLENLTYQGKPGWKPPGDTDFLAGLHFAGSGIVIRKSGGTYQGNEYRNIQVASLGDTFTFKRVDTSVFDQITEETKAYLSGQLDPHIVSTGTYVSDELVPVIRQYRPGSITAVVWLVYRDSVVQRGQSSCSSGSVTSIPSSSR
jgi:hypothetical protein